ncbi:MAG: MATE family efflux transporter [Flavobacteriales bacterium]
MTKGADINHRLDTSLKAMLAVSLPISLGYFIQFFIAFTDNFFCAKLSGNAMSAASFVGLIYITLVMVGIGLSNASQILVARRKGEGRYADVGAVVGNALWIGLFTACIQFVLLFVAIPPLLDAVISSDEVRVMMKEFLHYRAFGFFFYTLTLILQSFWSGIANTRVMMYSTFITALVNTVLAYALIFGKFGLPAMGLAGGAIASVVAEGCAFAFMILYTWFSRSQKEYALNASLFSIDFKNVSSIFKLGLPISLQMMLALGIWSVFYEFVEDMGEAPLQSSFIVRNMYSLVWVSVGGIGICTKTYISGLIAEGRQSELRSVIKKLMLIDLTGVVLLSHGLWLYPRWIAAQFSTDAVVIQQTVDCMLIVLPAMLVFAFTSVMLAVLEGSGNATKGFIVELITTLAYIGAAYLMIYTWKWPIHLVWTADYIYFVVIGLLSMAFLWNGKWKYHKI